MSAHYRVYRHIILILAVIIIILNQFAGILDFNSVFTKPLFLYLIPVTISYLAVIYFTLYFSIPRYILTKRYLRFTICLILSVFFLILVMDISEFVICKIANIPLSEQSALHVNNFFTDVLFNLLQLSIAIMGVGSIVMLKEWMKENKNILQLQNEIVQSEVEQLKEQVAPEMLFKILNHAASTAKDDTEGASVILIKLSHILRYQLYDCARNRVLLKSEIFFIENYLTLLQLIFNNFKFNIIVKGQVNLIFVSPLLFSSILQKILDKLDHNIILHIEFVINENSLSFVCKHNYMEIPKLEKITKRLHLLYDDKYTLDTDNDKIQLQIPI